ncbi:3'-5' exonuclease [Alkalihalobacillus sp. LMS39]|uniref:3'-5' exonuclease n=1 Tax=Alkalihalobacillus sp. LMS39 TaxID=2924032 RepID=UPI001FB529C0|nr:3'-5' exonuclease [Alkalihalobacillus sp. LMS39]UOE92051.1 exonuclease domain-containing protein [Alkalihalobacillus sp. LMS39]
MVKQYVFFDFEMLCSNRGMSFEDMEAIRLGAVKYDIETENIYFFDRYIQPENKAPLSSFCKKLTGIDDCHLQEANRFPEVLAEFLTWVGGIKKSRFFSWSKSDATRLVLDSERHLLSPKMMKKIEKRYVDFQAIFAQRVSRQTPSVEGALNLYNMRFIGTPHHPMFDAYNTLRVYLRFLNEPKKSDVIMLQHYLFDEVPTDSKELNEKIKNSFQHDVVKTFGQCTTIYQMKEASKIVKQTNHLVKKYRNIVVNRSGLFSKDNRSKVAMLMDFSNELQHTFLEHVQYSAKTMIVDEYTFQPIRELTLKQG